jgi:hypothetical protein
MPLDLTHGGFTPAIVGTNDILECKRMSKNKENTARQGTLQSTAYQCELVAKEGWLLEREKQRTVGNSAIDCLPV